MQPLLGHACQHLLRLGAERGLLAICWRAIAGAIRDGRHGDERMMTATVNSVRGQSWLSQIVLWYRIGLSVKRSYRDWQARADRHVAEGAKKGKERAGCVDEGNDVEKNKFCRRAVKRMLSMGWTRQHARASGRPRGREAEGWGRGRRSGWLRMMCEADIRDGDRDEGDKRPTGQQEGISDATPS